MYSSIRSTKSTVLISGIALALVFGSIRTASAAGFVFSRTLSLGSSGPDVLELQKLLNSDPATQILNGGPGSPGQETAYFGALTANSVVRYQNRHYSEILAPNGLSVGTGVVGPATRAVLNAAELALVAPTSTSSPVSAVAVAPAVSPTVSTNPNLQNLDAFIADVNKVSTEKGVPTGTIATIDSQIAKDAATTTDLKQEFLNEVEQSHAQASTMPFGSFLSPIVASIEAVFDKAIGLHPALAQTGQTPFGGELLYSYFCSCSDSWLIGLEPLPPSYAVLLTYITGSQAYLSYNIPFTTELLGEYSNSGQCQVYAGTSCVSVPSEGLISPLTGSAST